MTGSAFFLGLKPYPGSAGCPQAVYRRSSVGRGYAFPRTSRRATRQRVFSWAVPTEMRIHSGKP